MTVRDLMKASKVSLFIEVIKLQKQLLWIPKNDNSKVVGGEGADAS